MLKHSLTILLALWAYSAGAQKVNITKVEIVGDRVVISYEVASDKPGQLYDISLFSSMDNYTYPLIFTSGDVGKNVKAGSTKKIQWEAGKEVITFKGNVTFEVKAGLTYTPLAITSPYQGQVLRRGKTYPLYWSGGGQEPPSMELYQGENKLMEISKPDKANSATLSLPVHLKIGNDYSIRLTGGNGWVSTNFKVKRKIPLLVKLAPAVLLGAGAAVLLTGRDKKAQENPSAQEIELPNPPQPSK